MLDAWKAISDPTTRVIAAFGDSTGQGTVGVTNGGYCEILRELMRSRWGKACAGFFGTWWSHWSYTTGGNAWTNATVSDAWDVGPYMPQFSPAHTKRADTASKIATWTKPSGLQVTSFTLYMVDGAGSGNFSYSIDGGSYTNVSNSWNQDNSLDAITINSPVSSTVAIRGANASGTGVNTYLVGIEPHSGTTGVKLHNLCVNGEATYSVVRTTAGDWGKWIDLVQPDLITIMYTNDVLVFNATDYQNRLQSLISRVTAYGGEAILMSFFEQDGRDTTTQATMRSIHASLAQSNNIPHINFYDLVGGGYSAAVAAGYMSDALHPSNSGAVFIANHMWAHIGRTDRGVKLRKT